MFGIRDKIIFKHKKYLEMKFIKIKLIFFIWERERNIHKNEFTENVIYNNIFHESNIN